MRPRLLIVDDHAGFRASARRLLEAEGFTVVGEADGARSALPAVAALSPDVVLVDIALPDGDGFDVCAEIVREHNAAVVLTSSRTITGLQDRLLRQPGVWLHPEERPVRVRDPRVDRLIVRWMDAGADPGGGRGDRRGGDRCFSGSAGPERRRWGRRRDSADLRGSGLAAALGSTGQRADAALRRHLAPRDPGSSCVAGASGPAGASAPVVSDGSAAAGAGHRDGARRVCDRDRGTVGAQRLGDPCCCRLGVGRGGRCFRPVVGSGAEGGPPGFGRGVGVRGRARPRRRRPAGRVGRGPGDAAVVRHGDHRGRRRVAAGPAVRSMGGRHGGRSGDRTGWRGIGESAGPAATGDGRPDCGRSDTGRRTAVGTWTTSVPRWSCRPTMRRGPSPMSTTTAHRWRCSCTTSP